MNEAHLHLVVNHFPIIGTFFGLGILAVGLFLKNDTVKRVAFSIFIVAAIFAAVSMATGEGAEEVVENIPGISENIIEEHEEMAEKLALILYGIGLLSVFSFIMTFKNKSLEKYIAAVVLILSFLSAYLSAQTGVTGGEIRHTEIRSKTTVKSTIIENKQHSESEED